MSEGLFKPGSGLERALNEAAQKAAGSTPPAPEQPTTTPELIEIPYGEINSQELRNKLWGNFSIFDPQMENESVLRDRHSNISRGLIGHWFAVENGNFYQLIEGQGDNAELVRAHVRPRLMLTDYMGGDFWAKIDTRGKVSAQNTAYMNPRAKDDWLADKIDSPINIEKKGSKLLINGEKRKGKVHEIQLNDEGEKIYLVKTKDGWDLVNQQVYEARYPRGKEAAEKKDWNVPVDEWFADAPKGLKKFWEQGIKPRGWKDAVALFARAVSDTGIPGAWTVGFALMGINLASVGIKELSSLKKSGSFKDYWKQTSIGRLLTDNTKTGLTEEERTSALFLGGIVTAFSMAASEITAMILPMMPGRGAFKYFLNRALLGYVGPELVALAGKKIIFGKEAGREEQVKEWLGLTLGAMSTTVVVISTAMFAGEGAHSLIGLIEQRMAAIPTEVIAATGTALPPTETAAPTVVPTIPPTEVMPPTPEFSWSPGIAVDKPLLQHAADQNYGWGIDVNDDGKADFQAFWLDQNAGPDVVVDAEHNHFIRSGDHFFLDADKNGLIDQNEMWGAWKLGDFDSKLQPLDVVNQIETPNLPEKIDGAIDIAGDDIAKAGAAHLASPALSYEADVPLPPQIDLNGDHRYDLVKDGQGYFSDNNFDGVYTKDVDTRITELDFDIVNRQIDKAVYEDGSLWLRSDDGELVGVLPNGKTILLNDSSGTSRLQAQMHGENPAWSPQQVGVQAVINPNNVPIPDAPATQTEPPPPPIPERVIETEHGSWHQPRDGGQAWGVKSNGERLILGPDGGVQGVLELKLHSNNLSLSPDDTAVIAHRVALENRGAFNQPVNDDGSNVVTAMNDPVVQQNIDFNTKVVFAERFLESHADWLKNNHFDLSIKERYEAAKLVAPQWLIDWDDDDKKNALLGVIPQVEAKYD